MSVHSFDKNCNYMMNFFSFSFIARCHPIYLLFSFFSFCPERGNCESVSLLITKVYIIFVLGEHKRMGALDVCPFIPVQGVTIEDCVQCAKTFGERAATELGIPGI